MSITCVSCSSTGGTSGASLVRVGGRVVVAGPVGDGAPTLAIRSATVSPPSAWHPASPASVRSRFDGLVRLGVGTSGSACHRCSAVIGAAARTNRSHGAAPRDPRRRAGSLASAAADARRRSRVASCSPSLMSYRPPNLMRTSGCPRALVSAAPPISAATALPVGRTCWSSALVWRPESAPAEAQCNKSTSY